MFKIFVKLFLFVVLHELLQKIFVTCIFDIIFDFYVLHFQNRLLRLGDRPDWC